MNHKYKVGDEVYLVSVGKLYKHEITSVNQKSYCLNSIPLDWREERLFQTRAEGLAMFERMLDEAGL